MGSVSAANMLAIFFLVMLSCVRSGSARDSLITGNWICDDGSTLVSMDGTFELGFFSTPVGSSSNRRYLGSSSNRRYLGIWYRQLEETTVVWVANRNQSLSDNFTSTCFGIRSNGTLMAWDGKQELLFFPSENTSVRVVQLMNSGNLVFRVNETGEILWESFHDPTDTFLPGMKMNETLNLTSWISPADPAPGNYVFQQEKLGNEVWIKIYNSSKVSWSAEASWNLPHYMNAFLYNLSSPNSTKNYSRLVLNFTGEMRYLTWDNGNKRWSASWWAKGDRCSTVDNVCGKSGTCNANNAFMCKCLPGFVPLERNKWKGGDFSGGCRISPECGHSFLSLKMIKVRKYEREILVKDEENCREVCRNDCSCIAYTGVRMVDREGGSTPSKCWVWYGDLPSLQEEDRDGYNLSVRVLKSEIESTTRNCETCGSNVIPYPLSTGPNCGDRKYFNFSCDNDTGQVWFKVNNSSYRISDIEPKKSKFVIQVKNANFSSPMVIPQILKLKPPFNVTRLCNPSKTDELISCHSEMTLSDSFEMEISWDPPAEPECTSWEDCKDWPLSNCTKRGKVRKCFCKKNFRWDGQSLNCTQESGNQKLPLKIVVGISVAVALVAISSTLGYIAYLFHRTITERAEKRANRGRHLYDSEKRMKHLIDSEQFKEEDKKEIDIPLFDLEEILAATDDFSDANKLGQGGFGPVYKGKLPEGPEIAIKRLSKASGQGLQEFKNEVLLIAKLQHRNLVRLLGYCIEGDEKILLYEYMRNKSLDTFIFDRTLCILLNWGKRFDIILGIARGLLYLHQDSRLKIIHRDLKLSNILLDDDMNPKISDFGLARIFDSKQAQASTSRIIGTYGYMSPEYALDGYFSEKSDVFSFGVMILEIISGKRNTGFYQSDQALSLLGHAWKLWKEGKALELMDQTLTESCNGEEFSRCVNVGLLCVQEDPGDRPTMASAVLMLSSDVATMPVPKEPAFIVKSRGFSSTASSSGKAEEASWKNDLLAPIGEGR